MIEERKKNWKERIKDLSYDVLEAVDNGEFERANEISKEIEEILKRVEESRKLREEINKDPQKWLNLQAAWWNKNRHRDRTGDIIDGKLEDVGFYGGRI